MLFFRLVLCVAGLLLYLAVLEFSGDDKVAPMGHDVLRPVPAAQSAPQPAPLFFASTGGVHTAARNLLDR